ncbi:unnamed protein product, partial [Ectocarpus sp. 8 AP-2014]
ASGKQAWADLRTEVTDAVQAQTPNLALASTFDIKDPETATSPTTTPAETPGRRFPLLLVGVFSVLAMVGLVRLLAFTAWRMALTVAATAHAYLQRMVSGIFASGLRRPFARLQAELTSALPRLWGAVSNLNLRLGRVEELHRCAMNARGAMCRERRRLAETVEWLTETVLNLEAIVSETRRVVSTAEWLATSIVNLQAIIGGGAAQLNHVTTLVNGLLTAAAQARRELDDARQENHFTYEQTQTTPATGGRLRLYPEKPFHPNCAESTDGSDITSEVCRQLHVDGVKHERRGRENYKQSKNGQGGT